MKGIRAGRATAAVVCVVLSSACGDGGQSDGRPTTAIDTVAGVVTIRHAGHLEPWGVEPLLAVGTRASPAGDPSPVEFGRVRSVIADGTGRLYVADGLALEVRVFGPDGAFLRSLGRRGGGPGEFEGLHGVAWLPDDTLLVADYGNARLARLTTGGEPVGQWPWLRITGADRFLFNGGPGEVFTQGYRVRESGAGGGIWVRHTTEGPQDTLDIPRAEPSPGSKVTCRGAGIGFFDNPYGPRLLAVPAPGSERVMAWSSQYRLVFIDPGGDTVRTLTRAVDPLPLPDSLWAPVEAGHREFREQWRGADCDGVISRPRHRPTLHDLYFDHHGRMLVEHATPDGGAFDLFDPDGRRVGTFPAPPDRDPSVPPFLRDDRLYLVTKDSVDVQTVRVYALERATARSGEDEGLRPPGSRSTGAGAGRPVANAATSAGPRSPRSPLR